MFVGLAPERTETELPPGAAVGAPNAWFEARAIATLRDVMNPVYTLLITARPPINRIETIS